MTLRERVKSDIELLASSYRNSCGILDTTALAQEVAYLHMLIGIPPEFQIPVWIQDLANSMK